MASKDVPQGGVRWLIEENSEEDPVEDMYDVLKGIVLLYIGPL